MAATQRDNQTTNAALGFNFPSEYDRLEYGQTVTPSEDYTVEQVRFYASRYKLNPGVCYVSIEETTGGLPNGSKITDNAAFDCPDTKTLTTVTFTVQPVLQSGTKYAIVFENPSGVIGTPSYYDDGKRLQIFGAGSTGTYYANGELVYHTTDEWISNTAQDLYFALWGSDIVTVPSKATDPVPANNATGVDFSAFGLSWTDGGGADTFDVWMGPSGSLVKVADAIVPSTYTVDITDVPTEQVIYWRVDATNGAGTTEGDVWTFDARPVKATTPTPEHATTEVDFSDLTLSWVDGGNADSYNVQIGDSVNLYTCYEGHTETSYTSNSDELITNGSFSNWSSGEPDGWNVEISSNSHVLECGDNEGYEEAKKADSGYGLCNIYNYPLFSSTVNIYQVIALEIGKRYSLSIEINKVVAGELTLWAGANGVDLDETISSVATHSWTFRATSGTELIAIKALAETDITIDNVSVLIDEIPYDEVVYWRIDAVNSFGTTEGDTWTFDPRPAQVSVFTPANGAADLILSAIGATWESPSANTTSYNVYFGLLPWDLTLVDSVGELLLDLVTVFPLYDWTYYWRVDSINDFGVTTGNEASFTTISFYPPLPSGVTLVDGIPTGDPSGLNFIIALRKLVAAANNKIWYEDI